MYWLHLTVSVGLTDCLWLAGKFKRPLLASRNGPQGARCTYKTLGFPTSCLDPSQSASQLRWAIGSQSICRTVYVDCHGRPTAEWKCIALYLETNTCTVTMQRCESVWFSMSRMRSCTAEVEMAQGLSSLPRGIFQRFGHINIDINIRSKVNRVLEP